MAFQLPSSRALSCFEASARLLSFTAAAEEMNLTQGAISRQIQELEQRLGVPLFRRLAGRIELTDAGWTYASSIRPLLKQIETAGDILKKNSARRTLTISALPTLSSIWLMPRLSRFSQENPNLDLRVISSIEPATDLDTAGQIAIRVGTLPGVSPQIGGPRISLQMTTNWAGISAERLFSDTLAPVCARSLIGDRIPRSAEEIAKYPLIHTSTRMHAWQDWLGAQDVEIAESDNLLFGHFFLSLEAARQGLGIALIPQILLEGLRTDDSFVVLPGPQIESAGAYYLLTHKTNETDAGIVKVRAWLMEQARMTVDAIADFNAR